MFHRRQAASSIPLPSSEVPAKAVPHELDLHSPSDDEPAASDCSGRLYASRVELVMSMAGETPARPLLSARDRIERTMATPAQITADRRNIFCRVLAMPELARAASATAGCQDAGEGRSKPEFCKNEPVSRRNQLICFDLEKMAFTKNVKKLAKTAKNRLRLVGIAGNSARAPMLGGASPR
jgi:hypothetical protein